MNILSKTQIEKQFKHNKENYMKAVKQILERNLTRDRIILEKEVFPCLRQTIALMHYTENLEYFRFSLPAISFEDFDVTDEQKENIFKKYYLEEEILWMKNPSRGEMSKASMIRYIFKEHFGVDVLFKNCCLNSETGMVDFEVRMYPCFSKADVHKEKQLLTAQIDSYIKNHFSIEIIASKIEKCYKKLLETELVALEESDLSDYPLLELNADELLTDTDFMHLIKSEGEKVKLSVDNYVKESKLIASVQRTMRKHGYKLHADDSRLSKEDVFRSNGINFTVTVCESQPVKKPKMVKGEELQKVFLQRKQAYDTVLKQRVEQENEKMMALVESGHFDEQIALEWLRKTVMTPQELTDIRKSGRSAESSLCFDFIFPFEREIEGLLTIERKRYFSNSLGNVYMGTKGNVLCSLKERYPFLKHMTFTGRDFFDYHETEIGERGLARKITTNTLKFSFVLEDIRDIKNMDFERILDWVAFTIGPLDIEPLLNQFQFDEEGIAKTINESASKQTFGTNGIHFGMSIPLMRIDNKTLTDFAEKNLRSQSMKDMYKDEHQDWYYNNWRYTAEYKQALMNQMQSYKRCNLFVHAFMLHRRYQQLKSMLKQKGYELAVEYAKTEQKRMVSGNKTLHGDDIMEDVCLFEVEVIVR